VGEGTLVSLDEARAAFPSIPGVEFPTVLNELQVLDYGAEFGAQGGRLTLVPPIAGPSYRVLVPLPDEDGVAIAGIRPIETRAPLGTNTGWNVRAAGSRAPNLCELSGSFLPFARTERERLASGDPRNSLEERYGDHQGYVEAVRDAAEELVEKRFLLEEDADRFVRGAEASTVLR
jgi:hypothetical protein